MRGSGVCVCVCVCVCARALLSRLVADFMQGKEDFILGELGGMERRVVGSM